jgi:acetyl-CoA carboxylase biotin carboxyl carrier protein
MVEKPSDSDKPLDIQRLHYLVRLMKRYDLTALDVNDGSLQVRLRRRSPHEPASHVTTGPTVSVPPAASQLVSPARMESPATSGAQARTVVIESPMVGTYYASSAPDAPTFVSVGSVVQPNTIVCIIEAMKVFTDIPAGVSGTIAEILVKNGQAVEFSQPLFRVIPA